MRGFLRVSIAKSEKQKQNKKSPDFEIWVLVSSQKCRRMIITLVASKIKFWKKHLYPTRG